MRLRCSKTEHNTWKYWLLNCSVVLVLRCMIRNNSVVHGATGCSQKSFTLIYQYHQLLPWFLAIGHLSRESRQSHLLSNNKDDNEMILEAVRRSPGVYLTAGKNFGKPQLGNHLMEAVQPVIAANRVRYLLIMSLGSHKTSSREKEWKSERVVRYHFSERIAPERNSLVLNVFSFNDEAKIF